MSNEPNKILVVDDTPENLTVLFNRLTQYGFKVLVAPDGENAIHQARYGNPDLILLDVMMPGIDGFNTCRQLKEITELVDVPVIFMTALTDSESKMRGFEVGGVDYVTKPLDYKEVVARIRTHVTIRKLQQDLIAKNERLAQEVAERKQVETDLRQSEERYALAAKGANDGLWDWNVKTHQVYYSHRWKNMLGYRDEEIDGSLVEWFSRVHPEDWPVLQQKLITHLHEQSESFECECRMLHQNGQYQWILCRGVAVRNEQGQSYRMAGSQTDISHRKAAEVRLRHEIHHDALTGLPNRTAMMEKLHQLISHSQKQPESLFAMLFLDLDNFKLINDTYGHLTGDKLLIAVAQRIKQCVRPRDMVARLGGDEFTILLEDVYSVEDTNRVANRIQRALAHPIILGGDEIFVTVSIGITMNSHQYNQAEDLLRDADKAMYRAKSSGKGNHKLFDADAAQRLQLEKALRQAVLAKTLNLNYQPMFTLNPSLPYQRVAKPALVGVIGTVDWSHPTFGIITAATIRPIIEEIGLSHYLDSWLLENAGQQLAVWRASGYPNLGLMLSVSLYSIEKPMFIEQIKRLLGETNLPPESLCLNINGSVKIQNSPHQLAEIAALGVQLSLDQFGHEQGCLTQLKTLPLHRLKIASSFVPYLGQNQQDETIVKAIINLAKAFNLTIVCGEVRTSEQFEFLCKYQCHYAYGSWFGKPAIAPNFNQLYPPIS